MNNRFTHCVSVNEATSLLCLYLSSEADDNDKRALNDEYDTFLAFAGEEDWQEEDHSDPVDLIEQDAEEISAFFVSMDDLDDEPTCLNLYRTPDDDSLDWLDEVCGEDGELDEEATYSNPDNIAFLAMVKEHKENYGKSDSELPDDDDLGDYPPGMTRCDLIHVGEIEPDED
ncbi:hypothetical protein [Aquimarina algiphila]|uniref:Uncharacterized protein n=1 Tax=Aquimarina algiphila TaxID=2047982 RepID=A0A554VCC4_9FLAO|nr:hypothetical protein [Aquimarina algiphila]TSE04357.1 hypothetical protein FOF46_26385 [Aquimarina algiphila]